MVKCPCRKYASVKAVDEPLSGNMFGAVLLRSHVSERGIFYFYMEGKT
jgi:hypothetical protein